jgi:beta-phosphoglucomutase
MLSNPRAVIFDMDGVICHTNPYHSLAWKSFLEKHHIAATEADFVAHMYGKSNSYILRHFLGREITGAEFDQMEYDKEALFRKLYAEHVEPIAGLVPFVEILHQQGVALGVATSAPRANLDLIFGQLPLRPLMGSLLASEDVEHHKPHPEVYLRSAANLGVAPDVCVVFEDSFSGIMAARNAGMKVVGVLSTYRPEELPVCDAYVSDYEGIDFEKIQKLFFEISKQQPIPI